MKNDVSTVKSGGAAYARGRVLTPLQRAIMVEVAARAWPRRGSGTDRGGAIAAAIHMAMSRNPDPDHAVWLARAGDFDWTPMRSVTRAAYRRYCGQDGPPTPAFHVSYHRAIHTLQAKGLVELVNKRPRTLAKKQRRQESLASVRPTLAGMLAVLEEPSPGDYSGEALPKEPGRMEAYRISRLYWKRGSDGYPYPTRYEVKTEFPYANYGRQEHRWTAETWAEWWQREAVQG